MSDGRELLTMADVAFGFPDRPIFEGLSLRARSGDRIGVLGENGTGKSTALRLATGELVPAAGAVTRRGSLTYIPQQLDAGEATVGELVLESLAEVTAAAAALEEAVANFDHETGNLTDLTAATARLEALRPWDAERRLEETMTRLGAHRDVSRRLAELSVGERYRTRLACALARQSEILVVDEPTNHLDDAATDFLTSTLAAWAGAVVIVTHDRRLLSDVATEILDLDPAADGRPTRYRGDYRAYRAAKEEATRRWRRAYRAQMRRTQHLEEVLDQSYEGLSDEWRPPKGSEKHRRGTRARIHVKAADRQLQALAADALPVPEPPPIFSLPVLPGSPAEHDPGEPVLVAEIEVDGRGAGVEGAGIEGAGVGDAGQGDALVELPPALAARAGERIELAPGGRLLVTGANGIGKSTLLRALAGSMATAAMSGRVAGESATPGGAELPGDVRSLSGADPSAGARLEGGAVLPDGHPRNRTALTVRRAPGVRIGVLVQDGPLRPPESAATTGEDECTREVYRLLGAGELDPAELVPAYDTGLLAEQEMQRPLAELSTGQRRRFELLRALIAAPHVLILDEPTNHLSVDLVEQLTAAIRKTSAAVVVATHDRRMRADLADWPTITLG